MKTFTNFLAEAGNLAPFELYKYDWRLDLFINKYKEGQPFTVKDGTEAFLVYDENIEKQLRNNNNPGKIVFKSKDNRALKLGDFVKTKEFGGGGGSGAGAAQTKTLESAQAVYCQARWMGKTDYTPEELKAAYDSTFVDETLENIVNGLSKEYRESCILAAELLYKQFGSKNYQFYRGSNWVSKLENTFKTLNRREKHFANLNKWSPADIYMVSPVGKSIKFNEASDLVELNNMLIESMRTKDVFGISLKLLKKTAKISYVNYDSSKKIIKFDKLTTGTKGFFNTKDIYLFFTLNGKIQFRTFGGLTFQGEIKGKNANHGKVSYGPVQTLLKQLKLPPLYQKQFLLNAIDSHDKNVLHDFYSQYTRYSVDGHKFSYDEFVEELYTKDKDWIYSKMIGCQLIDIISKHRIENEFITACIQYASSSSELSAPFLKIQ